MLEGVESCEEGVGDVQDVRGVEEVWEHEDRWKEKGRR